MFQLLAINYDFVIFFGPIVIALMLLIIVVGITSILTTFGYKAGNVQEVIESLVKITKRFIFSTQKHIDTTIKNYTYSTGTNVKHTVEYIIRLNNFDICCDYLVTPKQTSNTIYNLFPVLQDNKHVWNRYRYYNDVFIIYDRELDCFYYVDNEHIEHTPYSEIELSILLLEILNKEITSINKLIKHNFIALKYDLSKKHIIMHISNNSVNDNGENNIYVLCDRDALYDNDKYYAQRLNDYIISNYGIDNIYDKQSQHIKSTLFNNTSIKQIYSNPIYLEQHQELCNILSSYYTKETLQDIDSNFHHYSDYKHYYYYPKEVIIVINTKDFNGCLFNRDGSFIKFELNPINKRYVEGHLYTSLEFIIVDEYINELELTSSWI